MFMVIVANQQLPSLTAQAVGRDLYHGRQDVVQIIGDKNCLRKIAWIFETVPDLFDAKFQNTSLVVRRAEAHSDRLNAMAADTQMIPLPVGEKSAAVDLQMASL
jgi:hypothetical protein